MYNCLLEIYALIPHLPTYTVYLINQNIFIKKFSAKIQSSNVSLQPLNHSRGPCNV